MGLKILKDRSGYYARLSQDQKPTVVQAGFVWEEDRARWEGSPRAAWRLFDHVEDYSTLLTDCQIHINELPAAPRFPKNRGITPFEHQLMGARWVLTRRASYIAFDAGLGKTLIVPLCLNADDGATIVVCPPFLKLNWEDELERGLTDFHVIQILSKASDLLNPDADIYIVPDSLLHVHEFREQFFRLGKKFKYLFIDEAHRYKNPDARRTMSLIGRRDVKLGRGKNSRHVTWRGFHHLAERRVCLSGTPMPNRPIELHALINRHAPHALGFYDHHRYGVRFCAGHEKEYGWDYQGHSNLDQLHHFLSRNYMIVRKKRDCLDMPEKLPPKFIYIDDERGEYARDEMRLLRTMKIDEIIRIETERNLQFKARVQDMIEDNPNMGGFGFISELRKMLGLSKVKASVQVISELMDEQEKLVVFCWHKEVADALCSGLSDYYPLMIVGGMSHPVRHKIVKAFQTNSRNRILVANIQAAGVGITLTKAKRVVFVEPSWVPTDNDQAFDRIDRIGQDEDVQAMFLVVKNSLDHMILNAHINKSEVINAAIKPLY